MSVKVKTKLPPKYALVKTRERYFPYLAGSMYGLEPVFATMAGSAEVPMQAVRITGTLLWRALCAMIRDK